MKRSKIRRRRTKPSRLFLRQAQALLQSRPWWTVRARKTRREFYQRIAKLNAAPLWEVLSDIVGAQPHPASVPALWRYDEMRPFLMESGELITAREAERRVLMLENPGFPGGSRIAQSVYAGLAIGIAGRIHQTATATWLPRCASSSKARALTPLWMASASACIRAI